MKETISILIQNFLVLASVIGLVLTGWLAGHILHFSTPALWHPPVEKDYPQIKTGFEFEFGGIRRLAILPETSRAPQVRVYLGEMQVDLFEHCAGSTYYTSLPAKCRSVDGRLVQAGAGQREVFIIPYGEWER